MKLQNTQVGKSLVRLKGHNHTERHASAAAAAAVAKFHWNTFAAPLDASKSTPPIFQASGVGGSVTRITYTQWIQSAAAA